MLRQNNNYMQMLIYLITERIIPVRITKRKKQIKKKQNIKKKNNKMGSGRERTSKLNLFVRDLKSFFYVRGNLSPKQLMQIPSFALHRAGILKFGVRENEHTRAL